MGEWWGEKSVEGSMLSCVWMCAFHPNCYIVETRAIKQIFILIEDSRVLEQSPEEREKKKSSEDLVMNNKNHSCALSKTNGIQHNCKERI